MNDILKPCPFCGGEAELTGFQAPEFWVRCPAVGCKAGTEGFGSKERAIAAWNTRATPANGEQVERLEAEIARLRGLLIDPGSPAWEDTRAVLAAELRKAEMPNHARAVEQGEGPYIPSHIALNLITHARQSTPTEDARERVKVLEKAQSILASLKARMSIACDNRRAGKDHVKVRIADWHALMGLGDRARAALGNKHYAHSLSETDTGNSQKTRLSALGNKETDRHG